jgi:hypothetical protein
MEPNEAEDKLRALRENAAKKRHDAAVSEEEVRDEQARMQVTSGKRATSRLGFFASFGWLLLAAPVTAFGVFMALVGFLSKAEAHMADVHREEAFFGLDLASAGVAMILLILVARVMVNRGVARELDWLESLPFAVNNATSHFRLMGNGYADVTVEFREMPERGDFYELLAGANGHGLTIAVEKFGDHEIELRTKSIHDGTVRGQWRAWHVIVDDLFVPLHARHPIAEIRILVR